MMKAGEYYIGDLCYVLHDVWDDVCELIIRKDECLEGEFQLPDGRKFAIYDTYWGDGEYRDQDRQAYSVDAGSIGCVLLSDINFECPNNDTKGGRVVNFPYDFGTGSDGEGRLTFGHIVINTKFDEQEEEDEYEY